MLALVVSKELHESSAVARGGRLEGVYVYVAQYIRSRKSGSVGLWSCTRGAQLPKEPLCFKIKIKPIRVVGGSK